ncbi:MAG: enoyl-CoA hydratase [Hyphomonadaceae bacterium]
MAGGRVSSEAHGAIGWITFDHPARHNALSLGMMRDLCAALDAHAQNQTVRVVILRGAGEKAFISGADISEFGSARANAEAAAAYGESSARAWEALSRFEKPLIAMIAGYCIGGGLAVALKTDIRIATPDSQFAIPAARLGLAYTGQPVRDLVNAVGVSEAKAILFTAKRMGAEEALRLGLINEIVTRDVLEARVTALAESIAANAPLTVRAAKEAVNQIAQARPDAARMEALSALCFDSADYAEGRKAFAEKRPPVFEGR